MNDLHVIAVLFAAWGLVNAMSENYLAAGAFTLVGLFIVWADVRAR